jgi:hypothetical protein
MMNKNAPVSQEYQLTINGEKIEPHHKVLAQGRVFRTRAFAPVLEGFDGETMDSNYLNAICTDPDKNKWSVTHYHTQSNFETGEKQTSVSTLETGLSYFQALTLCASFEEAKKSEHALPTEDSAPEKLGLRHYRSFAASEAQGKENGVIFDVNGMPQPSLYGQPLTEAEYTAQTLDDAQENFAQKPHTLQRSWGEVVLDDLVTHAHAPLSVESFMQAAEVTAHSESMLTAMRQIEAAFTQFLGFFDDVKNAEIEQTNITEYLDKTPLKSVGLGEVFNKTASSAASKRKRVEEDARFRMHSRYRSDPWDDYERNTDQYMSDAILRERAHARLGRKIEEYSGLLDKGDLQGVFVDLAKQYTHQGKYGDADEIMKLQEDMQARETSLKDAIENNIAHLKHSTTALQNRNVHTQELDRYIALTEATYAIFKARAVVAVVRYGYGQKRIKELPQVQTAVKEAADAFDKIATHSASSQDTSARQGLISSILSTTEKPSVPIFLTDFADRFETALATATHNMTTAPQNVETQLNLDLTGGRNGFFGVHAPEAEFIDDLLKALKTANDCEKHAASKRGEEARQKDRFIF